MKECKARNLHKTWSRRLGHRVAYNKLSVEFQPADALIEARSRARLTQVDLVKRMKITQSVVARLESRRVHLSSKTLEKIARAAGTRFKISFEAGDAA